MKKTTWILAAVAVAGLVALVPADGLAGDVKEANATCMSATAILMVSDGADEAKHWAAIRSVVESNKKHWTIVSTPERSSVGRVALTRWSIKHTYKGGPTAAFTVQCGHGGTCNDIAQAMARKFPGMVPAPSVHCDVENLLESPTPAP